MDVIMSIEPIVLEVPTGIVDQPKRFSRQETGQERDAGAHNSAYASFLSSEKKKSIFFRGETEIGITYQLGTN